MQHGHVSYNWFILKVIDWDRRLPGGVQRAQPGSLGRGAATRRPRDSGQRAVAVTPRTLP